MVSLSNIQRTNVSGQSQPNDRSDGASALPQTSASDAARSIRDRRGPSRGWGRIIIAALWVFAVVVTYTAIADFFTLSSYAVGPRLVSVIAAIGYLVIAIALTHNGRRMRMLAWAAIGFEITGLIVTGLIGMDVKEIGEIRNIWANFGVQYGFLPVLVPVVALGWMWWSNPRRIVEIAEMRDRA